MTDRVSHPSRRILYRTAHRMTSVGLDALHGLFVPVTKFLPRLCHGRPKQSPALRRVSRVQVTSTNNCSTFRMTPELWGELWWLPYSNLINRDHIY